MDDRWQVMQNKDTVELRLFWGGVQVFEILKISPDEAKELACQLAAVGILAEHYSDADNQSSESTTLRISQHR